MFNTKKIKELEKRLWALENPCKFKLGEKLKGDAWICQHIGMSKDELLRLKQITGLASLFQNKEFSKAWEADFIPEIEEN